MADWDVASAVASLRSLLGDGPTDKFEFKADVFPTPDGVTTRFFVGETRVYPGSLEVYQGTVLVTPVAPPEWVKGTFALTTAPSGNVELQASFYYQWFGDDDLNSFITQATHVLGFTGITDATLVAGIRPAVLQFAAYNAYMRKAAEHADSVVATAVGYTADQSRSHPNWRELARTTLETARATLKLYVDNPLVISSRPVMQFVSFCLPSYQRR